MTVFGPRPGDRGQTSIGTQTNVWKDSPLLEVLGDLDELNCHLGLVRTLGLGQAMDSLLARIQKELLQMGAELASGAGGPKATPIRPEQVEALEDQRVQWGAGLPDVRSFILPSGSQASCQLHLARAVCRRAERRLASLVRQSPPGAVSPTLQAYLNRLSNLLFVLARSANQQSGHREIPGNGFPHGEPAP